MAGAAVLSLSLTACGSDDGDNEKGGETPSADAKFTNDECADGSSSADTFKVGGILPLTGSLSSLGPPEIAGVGLAVSDINAAGGVDGAKACHVIEDSGDADDNSVSTASAGKMLTAKPSVVIGAASSSVTLNFVDTLTDNKIVQISPANTATVLSGYDPFYFRTAPPDSIQGNVAGTLIASDGHKKLAFLVFNEDYGTGLRDQIQKTFEASGGEVVYGATGKGQEFSPKQDNFSADVTAAINAKPDAIVVLAFEQTTNIIPELASQAFDLSKTYYTDGNAQDREGKLDDGTLEGAQATIPGVNPEGDFRKNLSAWHEQFQKTALKDFTYGPESYHAVILSALAAAKGGDTSPVTIQKNMRAVSGDTGGEECTTYADCLKLVKEGKEIYYKGPAGIGPINDKNDPSTAFIGLYKYDGKNKLSYQTAVEGKS